MKHKNGFTLIELLVVIAIIAILAGIIFPVFARAKQSAFQSSDISNMNSLRTALQQYREDQGGYPPALLGYITPYEYSLGTVNVIPANRLIAPLYPKRVESIDTIRPALNRVANDLVVPAAWPNAGVADAASSVDVNGDGQITPADYILPAFASNYASNSISYFYDVSGTPQAAPLNCTDPANAQSVPRQVGGVSGNASDVVGRFYAVSGYDVGSVPANGNTVYELRYTRFWSDLGTCRGGGNDDPRQLGYAEPPETTVVTWNSYFRSYVNGALVPGQSKDVVLQLGGTARAVDSALMNARTWRFNR